jgi:hypothetical protein
MTGAGPQGHDRAEPAVLGCGGEGQRLSPSCSGRTPRPVGSTAVPSQVVQLACTACQLVYEPDFAAFDTGTTGCPRCGGWTWIAQLGASLLTATCGSALSVVREGDFR